MMLSEVGSRLKNAVEREFGTGSHWISAEISDMTVRKGHCYLHLVEKKPGAAAPACEMRAIIWAGNFKRISEEFKIGSGTELSRDTVILFRAVVRFDVKWGLSLIIDFIEPAYTLGLIQQERERTIAKLKQEGIFDHNKSLEFPIVPQNIALISSADSRGYEDFMRKLMKNIYNYRYNVELFPSRLQGDVAAEQIRDQLINIHGSGTKFDLVVIVRGGGGSVDLNCFNNYRLSRAVARFPLPVITGIGHTANVSVVDEVAYTDRITPTDAADYIVEKTNEFERKLNEMIFDVQAHSLERVNDEQERLVKFASAFRHTVARHITTQQSIYKAGVMRLKPAVMNLVRNSSMEVKGLQKSIRMNTLSLTGIEAKRLNSEMSRIPRMVSSAAREKRSRLSQVRKLLGLQTTRFLQQESASVERMEQQVKLTDPKQILKRGYSVTLHNGKVLRNNKGIAKGEKIKTILYEGIIESEVR